MTRLLRTVLHAVAAGVLAAISMVGQASPAAADCIGPTLAPIAAEVDRGTPVTITGTGWGDECYDTGSPPSGVGRLGTPIDDLEIGFSQGQVEVVVARGAADADYRFSVVVAVPVDLVPGDAVLWARRAGSAPGAQAALTVRPFVVGATPAPAVETLPSIAIFGPAATPTEPAAPGTSSTAGPSSTASSGPDPTAGTGSTPPTIGSSTAIPTDVSQPPALVIAGIAALVAAAFGCGFWVLRRRHPTDG